jgi:hypothetical protein
MKAYIWPATILLCVVTLVAGAPFTIRALREPVSPVNPTPAPVVETKFADTVAAEWAKIGNSDDACVLVEIYTAVSGVLASDTQGLLKDTGDLGDFSKLGSTLAFGKPKPFDSKYQPLQDLIRSELLVRGLSTDADKDGRHDIVALDHDGWVKLYGEVIEGLSR